MWIAEQILEATDPTGRSTEVVVRVGTPYQVGADEWACGVAVDGLHNQLRDIHGGSSLQALCLAASFARVLLSHFVEQGGQLFYAGTKDTFNIDACFSRIGATA